MNDLLRPALYEGWYPILSVVEDPSKPSHSYDIVGPVCESADFHLSSIQNDAKKIYLRSSLIAKVKDKYPETAQQCEAILRRIRLEQIDMSLLNLLNQAVEARLKGADPILAQKEVLYVFQTFEKVLSSGNTEKPSNHGSIPSP